MAGFTRNFRKAIPGRADNNFFKSGGLFAPANSLDIFGHRHHDAYMRTTLTLDPDVAAKAKKGAARLGKPFKHVINAALRIGLDEVLKPPVAKLYRTKPRPLGLQQGLSYDNVADLLARAEGAPLIKSLC